LHHGICGTNSRRVRLLLCSDPLTPGEPDSAFESENEAIKAVDLDHDLLDFESLIARDTDRALRRVGDADLGLVIYRGWMLPVATFSSLETAILDRGGYLINDAAAYERTHHLPGSYAVLAGHTPKTVWLEGAAPFEMARVHDALRTFDGGAAPHAAARAHQLCASSPPARPGASRTGCRDQDRRDGPSPPPSFGVRRRGPRHDRCWLVERPSSR
jgi:hypothetical protein